MNNGGDMDWTERVAKLKEAIQTAHREINDYEDAARFERNRDMAGKCYRVQNCYSSPEDYWWLYAQVTEVSADGYLSVWTFEQDKYGNIRIDAPKTRPYLGVSHEEIPPCDFWDEWYELFGRIQALAGIG